MTYMQKQITLVRTSSSYAGNASCMGRTTLSVSHSKIDEPQDTLLIRIRPTLAPAKTKDTSAMFSMCRNQSQIAFLPLNLTCDFSGLEQNSQKIRVSNSLHMVHHNVFGWLLRRCNTYIIIWLKLMLTAEIAQRTHIFCTCLEAEQGTLLCFRICNQVCSPQPPCVSCPAK